MTDDQVVDMDSLSRIRPLLLDVLIEIARLSNSVCELDVIISEKIDDLLMEAIHVKNT